MLHQIATSERLTPELIASLPLAKKLELLELLEAKERWYETNKLSLLYPDTGPLRRELYTKHLEFFRAGIEHRERCMMAANRVGKCVRGKTVIETIDGERTAFELWERGQSFRVWAWDGTGKTQTIACAPFKKFRLHQCYRVTMTDGRYFEAADLHRVLTCDGWRYLDELHRSFVGAPQASNSVLCQSTHGVDAGRWSETVQDLMGGCFEDFHPGDAQPRFVQGIGLGLAPSLGDALQHIVVSSRLDASVDRCINIVRRVCDRLSTQDAMDRFAGRAVEFRDCTDNTSVESSCGSSLIDRQLVVESAFQPQSYGERGRCNDDIRQLPLSVPCVDGSAIASIDAIGRHEVYDFHVPGYENYVTSGMVHHNTWGVGGYETTLHLTGEYPDWWEGRRFDHPIEAWAAGDTSETTRDIVQAALMGPLGSLGTGLVPADNIIGEPTKRAGVSGAMDTAKIRHKSGGISLVGFKSYDQGRKKFQGTAKHLAWLDEEPPMDVYVECLTRTMTVKGMTLCTFTPLEGATDVALMFLGLGE